MTTGRINQVEKIIYTYAVLRRIYKKYFRKKECLKQEQKEKLATYYIR